MQDNKDTVFCENFKKLRICRGLTIEMLSEKTGLSKTILYNYQEGKYRPTIKNLKRLTDVLECEIKDFYK